MLTSRNTGIFFGALLLVLLAVDFYSNVHWWVYGMCVLVFLSIQIYGSSFIQSGFHIKAYCSKPMDANKIAITFDDGPDKEITLKILDVLREFNVKATFFCIGRKIEGSEEIIKRIDGDGHLVGNHSYSHAFWFDLYGTNRMTEELKITEQKVQDVIGKQMKLFRPPYGVTTPNLGRAVKRLHYDTIGWNIRSMDTVLKDDNKIFEKVIPKIKPGSVLLLHDSVPQTAASLRKILTWIKENNYIVVRVDELFNLNPYA